MSPKGQNKRTKHQQPLICKTTSKRGNQSPTTKKKKWGEEMGRDARGPPKGSGAHKGGVVQRGWGCQVGPFLFSFFILKKVRVRCLMRKPRVNEWKKLTIVEVGRGPHPFLFFFVGNGWANEWLGLFDSVFDHLGWHHSLQSVRQ